MLALYVFSLILGGGFLAMSVFGDLFGGHGDVDMGGDLGGFDGHLELDAGGLDVDAGGLELDAGGIDLDAGHLDVGAAHAHLDADAGHVAAKIFSIRTLFYSLFGFGAVGTFLTFVWGTAPFTTAAFAVISGLAAGAVINSAFGYVKRSESGMLETESTYAGLPGRITLPLRLGGGGKVVVERGGRRIELRALPHPSGKGDPSIWKDVFIVEMERGVARVAPIDEDMLLGS